MKTDTCYSALATIYDRVMSHVEYRQWYMLIGKVIKRHLPVTMPRIFEVGGGTGILGRMLTGDGFRYIGSDLSPSMCRMARKSGLPFICADARRLPSRGPFHMVIFLYDGINYLEKEEYPQFFREAYRLLLPGGILLFDITTETNSRMHFVDFVDYEEFEDAFYLRHSYYEARTGIQHNKFTIFLRENGSGSYSKHHEHHRQRVLPVSGIKSHIPTDLFSILGIWDGYSLNRYTKRSDRIHFCLRKNQ
ncbi:MAG: methyltransferase domain-containing protein [Chitinivibrionales bacterium]|nr:methyltransferase domain-containing protein [Chitinivibrionales bacterium]MBD3355661.1 methyltransferase domain-containing protein [Chitinivibrionales bacterium]